jgi:hypothetical protein
MDARGTDGGPTRRELLRRGLGGALALTAAGWVATPRPGAADPPAPVPTTAPGFGQATAMIQVWLWGGPCHLDTFDPKPEAGPDYCGPYTEPIATNVDGIRICQALPLLARQADKYSLLRGLTHGQNGHETAAYLVQAGRPVDEELVFPGIGAVASHFAPPPAADALLPRYITITQTQGRFSEAGFLGASCMPFATGGDPAKDPFAVEGIVSEGIDADRQRSRRELLGRLDRLAHELPDAPLIRAIGEHRERAYELILGEAGKVFDLTREPAEIRDRYGRHRLGQSCLLARRLVEQGTRFITINARGWDTHKSHFALMNRMLPELDSGVASLLADLAERGLLERTIVWVGGEFGRGPKIQWEAPWNGGRNHYGKAFAALVAGGGLHGGRVVGATDARGETVIERPIWPWDLHATFHHLLGIPPDAVLPTPQGGQVRLSPLGTASIPPAQTGGMLAELL